MEGCDWYWRKGLHDAVVIKIRSGAFDYDYKRKNPIRNYFEIVLDSRSALFDSSVRSIKFYNYKMKDSVENLSGYWWIKDELSKTGEKFLLKIDFGFKKETRTIEIVFDYAEVIR